MIVQATRFKKPATFQPYNIPTFHYSNLHQSFSIYINLNQSLTTHHSSLPLSVSSSLSLSISLSPIRPILHLAYYPIFQNTINSSHSVFPSYFFPFFISSAIIRNTDFVNSDIFLINNRHHYG